MSTSVSNNGLFLIDKLNNGNFTIWKYRIEMVLKTRRLWKYVETEADIKVVGEREEEEDALAQIVLSIEHPVVGHVRGAKQPKKHGVRYVPSSRGRD